MSGGEIDTQLGLADLLIDDKRPVAGVVPIQLDLLAELPEPFDVQ